MTADMNDAEQLRKKRAFFDTFELLGKSDDEADPGLEASKAILKKAKTSQPEQRNSLARTDMRTPARVDPVGGADRQSLKPITIDHSKRPPSTAPNFDRPPPSAIPRTTSKRKGQNVIKLVPEAQQLFRNLQFYFFPNNDNNAARRLRILKALEFGASWQKEWNSFVTHVIVDGDLTYQALLDYLKLLKMPNQVLVVNDTWPAECLSYRTLLDPTRMMFRVRGSPIDVIKAPALPDQVNSASTEQASTSDTSLVLKKAGKAVQSRAPRTSTPGSQQSSRPSPEPDSDQKQSDDPQATSNISVTSLPEDFQAIISQARELGNLPLEEEETDSRPSSSAGATDPSVPGTKVLAYADNFQCMQAHTGQKDEGSNTETIRILQQMADYYGQTGDEWRTRAYRKAIATLRNHPEKISTKAQALALPNVGERLAEKIEEIAFTHRLRRLDHAQAEPGDQALKLFLKVYGVGYVQASGWVRKGYRTLDDLLQNAQLTSNQLVGIEHFENFNLRIPRAEVKQHADIVLNALHCIDKTFTLIVGGSYRRGSADSGDIDCVITHPTHTLDEMRLLIVDKIISPLTAQGFLKAELSAMSREDGSKWHGASCLPDSTIWRRIDLLLVPAEEFGAAMIYFTGNDIFNRSMRLLASKKGLRLNQRGLYRDVIRGKNRERITQGTLIEGRDEKKIFEILGVPWREPSERLI